MVIVMGGTGHVGRAVARALIAGGEAVTIVTRRAAAADVPAGARIAEADITDADHLRAIFRTGTRAFLLNPPGRVDGDPDAAEARSIDAILAALDGSGLEMLVAASTYGARAGSAIGDLGTLNRLEDGLRRQPIPVMIQRGAYYMSNWDAQLPRARDEGRIASFFPAARTIPMVAPEDLGAAAARRLRGPVGVTGVRHVEGPARYSAEDVAAAFARALGRTVTVEVVPRQAWTETYRQIGFSGPAARSFTGMTALAIDEVAAPDDPERGPTTLDAYIGALVAR